MEMLKNCIKIVSTLLIMCLLHLSPVPIDSAKSIETKPVEAKPVETEPMAATISSIEINSAEINTVVYSVAEPVPLTLRPDANYLQAKKERIFADIEAEKDFYISPEEPDCFRQEDLELLAIVIYQESGGEECCDDCRRRVADVVLNRVESDEFPDTIEGVLTDYRQYGRFYWTGVVWPDRAALKEEKEAVERAYTIAEEVLSGEHSDLYGEEYVFQAEFQQGTDSIKHCGIYFGKG